MTLFFFVIKNDYFQPKKSNQMFALLNFPEILDDMKINFTAYSDLRNLDLSPDNVDELINEWHCRQFLTYDSFIDNGLLNKIIGGDFVHINLGITCTDPIVHPNTPDYIRKIQAAQIARREPLLLDLEQDNFTELNNHLHEPPKTGQYIISLAVNTTISSGMRFITQGSSIETNHQCAIVINHDLKNICYFDPHVIHKYYIEDSLVNLFRPLIIKGYKFVVYTSELDGVWQKSKYDNGYCIYWSLLATSLMISNPLHDPIDVLDCLLDLEDDAIYILMFFMNTIFTDIGPLEEELNRAVDSQISYCMNMILQQEYLTPEETKLYDVMIVRVFECFNLRDKMLYSAAVVNLAKIINSERNNNLVVFTKALRILEQICNYMS
jgi:hypothetical protein